MALTTYTELQAAVADWLHRDDLTSQIVDAIALAEAELQADCKLVDFETTANVTITTGSGALPADFSGARSVRWSSDPDYTLVYVTPGEFDTNAEDTGDPYEYTIVGTTIKTAGTTSGTLILTYTARFTALASSPSNALLTKYPDGYLFGALKHISAYLADDAATQKFGVMFQAAKDRINKDSEQRKHAGPLEVRVR